MVRIVKLESSDAAYQRCAQKTESTEQLTNSRQNARDQGTAQNVNETMADDRSDEVNSETSSDYYMVDVDESDGSISASEADVIVLSETSHATEDTTEETLETSNRADDPKKLQSCAGASTSRNDDMQRTYASRQFQPFVKLKQLDSTEIKRFTDVKSAVPDGVHSVKRRYIIGSFLSVHITVF